MTENQVYIVLEFKSAQGKNPFRDWLDAIGFTARARIQARIFRFERGNLGDCKALGAGVFEGRVNFGPGYRIYFGIQERRIVVLLAGGDKSTQKNDIARAKRYWAEYIREIKNG